jgi:DNA-directed RNA polymerase subunit RPC12/RpoP
MGIMESWDWLAKANEEEKRRLAAQTTTNNLFSPTGADGGGSSNGGGNPATPSLSDGSNSSNGSTNSQPPQQQAQAQGQHAPPVILPKFLGRRPDFDTPDKKMYYVCDDCGTRVGFYANELYRCVHCGGMAMKKPRIKGYVFAAHFKLRRAVGGFGCGR